MSTNTSRVDRVRLAAAKAAHKYPSAAADLQKRIERALTNEGFAQNTDELSLTHAAEHFAEILAPLARHVAQTVTR